ncbi:multidrug efflux SMR transporter [Paenibacillus sp. Marseille-Q4541]|uniref:DMT family transporter n=1 Tax=Paenibacillus sp. Marseille-Q4541 TaxID=2831522 RepID=UPI001BA88AFF|nr:multidrug efflux SMR transporter [Paenibacillus sp. Marseille-Q4541]
MNSNWLKVLIAVFFEIGWAAGLKHAQNFWEWGATGVAIFLSFYLLISATKVLPVGTAYAIFVGLGTVGTMLVDVMIFGVALNAGKVLFVITLLTGVVGLKLVTKDHTEKEVS